MKKRFIVLIDFSAYAANVLGYAYAWSSQAKAELLLVHQLNAIAPAMASHQQKRMIIEDEMALAKHELRTLCAAVLPKEAQVTFLVSEIPLDVELPILLAEHFQQIVFIGLKGTGLLKKIFIGSVAVQVIDVAKAPVLALPAHVSRFAVNQLFVAVGDKYPFNQEVFHDLLDLVGQQLKQITFFYVAQANENTTDIRQKMDDLCMLYAVKYATVSKVYQAENRLGELKAIVKNHNHEILVVQKGSRLLTDQFFRIFTINELVYEGQIPMLVLP